MSNLRTVKSLNEQTDSGTDFRTDSRSNIMIDARSSFEYKQESRLGSRLRFGREHMLRYSSLSGPVSGAGYNVSYDARYSERSDVTPARRCAWPTGPAAVGFLDNAAGSR